MRETLDRWRLAIGVGAAILMLHVPVGAQQPDAQLVFGERVRVTAPSLGIHRMQAFFGGVRGDTVDLRFDDGGRRLPVSALTLEVQRADRGYTAFILGSAGILVGGVTGIEFYDASSWDFCFFDCPPPKSPETVARERQQHAVIGAAVGLVAGAVIGVVLPWRYWIPAQPEHWIGITPTTDPDGIGLRVRAVF